MSPTIGSTAEGAVSSHPPWWMLVLAGAFVGYFALLLHSDLTRPEPSGFVFIIHESAMIVRAVEPGSRAARAGLAAGERGRADAGSPVRRRPDLLRGEAARVDTASA